MKRGKQIDAWYPFWVDKWLFGSTRHELIVDENDQTIDLRGVFIDLLTLSKKDDGFIRANETTPYPPEQLAGLFRVPLEWLKRTIDICIKVGKLSEPSPGIYYVESTDIYALTDRRKRQISAKAEMASEKKEAAAEKADLREEKKRIEKIKKDKEKPDSLEDEFKEFWEAYGLKVAKEDAFNAYKALRRSGVEKADIARAVNGYHDFLKIKKEHENFDQQQMYPATFLRRNRWRDYIGIVYQARL